jgi:hypothetical protein
MNLGYAYITDGLRIPSNLFGHRLLQRQEGEAHCYREIHEEEDLGFIDDG